MADFTEFCAIIQKQCLPGIWSKGVAFARSGALIQDRFTDQEISYRVKLADRPVSPKVTLWPEDEDWYCDCGDRNEICAHVAAAAIALKSGPQVPAREAAAVRATEVLYRFSRDPSGSLALERFVRHGDETESLAQTLVALSGGISSGRLAWPPLSATQEEFRVDALMGGVRKVVLEAAALNQLLRALAECPRVTLDGEAIAVAATPVRSWIRVEREGRGYRLREARSERTEAEFENGAVLVRGTLRPWEGLPLSREERAQLAGAGRAYPEHEVRRLITEVIPRLEQRVKVERADGAALPEASREPPRIEVELSERDGMLEIVPRLAYASTLAVRDPEAERELARDFQMRHQLTVNAPTRLAGLEAVAAVARLERAGLALGGSGREAFSVRGELAPQFKFSGDGLDFEVSFGLASSAPGSAGGANASVVVAAWRENASLVPLMGGGWARLPEDWLARHVETLERLLDSRGAPTETARVARLPELIRLCEDSGVSIPAQLLRLKQQFETFTGIPDAPLPSDLRAELRGYQRAGVNWIAFMRELGLGALLADDMGLGKTLQAICAIRGKTLVVAPTSVLSAWKQQIEKFRPGLACATYHGPARKLDERATVVLTTYGILRSDRELLSGREWDMIVLDEAQSIRNPDSRAAQAAHSLRGGFRLALTGTPIENRLEDLWSQLEFLLPGFSGPREEWTASALTPERTAQIRRRIKPFILRRLKRDVAPELPPRIETTLACELSEREREFYGALLSASRADVLEKLGTGEKGGVFAALEALLRLRQACCDAALVPGHPPDLSSGPSSKIELLGQSLEQAIGLGHRALVFSQWTAMLDRIESELNQRGIRFSRLDGSTKDRSAVVERFQREDGESVMLISLKAGGVGLTLTAADHVYLMDPWWNPAAEAQAADRAHRIGQSNTVFIHRLVAAETIEERVLALQQAKSELARAVLGSDGEGETADAVRLTREDLLELLK